MKALARQGFEDVEEHLKMFCKCIFKWESSAYNYIICVESSSLSCFELIQRLHIL